MLSGLKYNPCLDVVVNMKNQHAVWRFRFQKTLIPCTLFNIHKLVPSKFILVFVFNLKYISQTDNTLSRIPKSSQETTANYWKKRNNVESYCEQVLILMQHLNHGHKMSVIKIQHKYEPEFGKHNYDFFNEVIAWSSEHWLKLKEASFTAKQ